MILQKVTFWRDLAQIIFKVYQTLLRLLRIKFKSPISIPRILDRRYLNNSPASFSLLSVSFDTVAKLLQLTRAKKGSGYGTVGRAVASNDRGPRFESSHGRNLINYQLY